MGSMIFKKQSKQRERLYRTREFSDKNKRQSYALDHNHTHFLLLEDKFGDNGDIQVKTADGEVLRTDLILKLRAQIERESRKITSQGQSQYLIHLERIPTITSFCSVHRSHRANSVQWGCFIYFNCVRIN